MKTIIVYSLLLIGLFYFSCNKGKNNLEYPFEAKVLGLNFDCGVYAIKITQGLELVKSIAGSTVGDSIYIAKNLPAELMTAGLNIKLDLRRPMDNELGICTDLGPSFTWVYVTDAIKK